MRKTPQPGAGKKRTRKGPRKESSRPPEYSIGIRCVDRTPPRPNDIAHRRCVVEVKEDVVLWARDDFAEGACTVVRWNEYCGSGEELDIQTERDRKRFWKR